MSKSCKQLNKMVSGSKAKVKRKLKNSHLFQLLPVRPSEARLAVETRGTDVHKYVCKSSNHHEPSTIRLTGGWWRSAAGSWCHHRCCRRAVLQRDVCSFKVSERVTNNLQINTGHQPDWWLRRTDAYAGLNQLQTAGGLWKAAGLLLKSRILKLFMELVHYGWRVSAALSGHLLDKKYMTCSRFTF